MIFVDSLMIAEFVDGKSVWLAPQVVDMFFDKRWGFDTFVDFGLAN